MSNSFNNFLTKAKNNLIYLLLIFSVILVFGTVGAYKFTKTTYKMTVPVNPASKFIINNDEIQLELFYQNNFFYSLDYSLYKDYLESSSIKKVLLRDKLNDYRALDSFTSFFNIEDRFGSFLKFVNKPNYLSEFLRQMKLSNREELFNIQDLRFNSEKQSFVFLIDDHDMTVLEFKNATSLILDNVSKNISIMNKANLKILLFNSIAVLESISRELKVNYKLINQKEIDKMLELYESYRTAESYAKVLGLDTQSLTTEEAASVFEKSSIPLDTILGLKNLRNIIDKIEADINILKSNKTVESEVFLTKLKYNDDTIARYRDLILNQVNLNDLPSFDYNIQEMVIEKYRKENDLFIISLILALSLSIVFLIVRKD